MGGAGSQIVVSETRAMPDFDRRFGLPASQRQFVLRIALNMMAALKLPTRQALPLAACAYAWFGVRFGHSGYAWDDDAARTMALEFWSDP